MFGAAATRVGAPAPRLGVLGLSFRVWDLGFRVGGLRLRDQGLGFRVSDCGAALKLGSQIEGSCTKLLHDRLRIPAPAPAPEPTDGGSRIAVNNSNKEPPHPQHMNTLNKVSLNVLLLWGNRQLGNPLMGGFPNPKL